jgi:hypothetical protein
MRVSPVWLADQKFEKAYATAGATLDLQTGSGWQHAERKIFEYVR